ncbi:hypothetical protein Pdw03_6435 [Penicillium digitatum]|uniref:Uncharacterized protein n=1 Tax=Penicillium digitatum TaxID=36651 RepID=A0A7T6XJX6_PENDI|nr:hypothetical protein Pdw03_6435 [Penicillium digitatum]
MEEAPKETYECRRPTCYFPRAFWWLKRSGVYYAVIQVIFYPIMNFEMTTHAGSLTSVPEWRLCPVCIQTGLVAGWLHCLIEVVLFLPECQ